MGRPAPRRTSRSSPHGPRPLHPFPHEGRPEIPAYFPDVPRSIAGALPLLNQHASQAPGSRRGESLQAAKPWWWTSARPRNTRQVPFPQSLNIGLDGQFASWAGTLVDPKRNLVIVARDRDEDRGGAGRTRPGRLRVGGGSPEGSRNGGRPGSRLRPRRRVTVGNCTKCWPEAMQIPAGPFRSSTCAAPGMERRSY